MLCGMGGALERTGKMGLQQWVGPEWEGAGLRWGLALPLGGDPRSLHSSQPGPMDPGPVLRAVSLLWPGRPPSPIFPWLCLPLHPRPTAGVQLSVPPVPSLRPCCAHPGHARVPVHCHMCEQQAWGKAWSTGLG